VRARESLLPQLPQPRFAFTIGSPGVAVLAKLLLLGLKWIEVARRRLWVRKIGSACKSCNPSVSTGARIEFAHPTGNRSQIQRPQEPQKQAKTVATRCDQLPLGAGFLGMRIRPAQQRRATAAQQLGKP
jgi:hypothetical protein